MTISGSPYFPYYPYTFSLLMQERDALAADLAFGENTRFPHVLEKVVGEVGEVGGSPYVAAYGQPSKSGPGRGHRGASQAVTI